MDKIRIACIGDSLTEGYMIRPRTAWPDLLNKEDHLEIFNSGICGDTTSGMLARFQEHVIRHQPDFVIIMGGTNDIWFNAPDSQIIGNIVAMTRHARQQNIQSIIGIPTPYYLPEVEEGEHFFMDLKGMKKRLDEFEITLRRFILEDAQPSIDFTQNMKPELFLEDGLHPNEEGHQKMFETAKKSLDSILLRR